MPGGGLGKLMQIAREVVARFAKILAECWGGDYGNGLVDPTQILGEALRALSFVWESVWASFCKDLAAVRTVLGCTIDCLPILGKFGPSPGGISGRHPWEIRGGRHANRLRVLGIFLGEFLGKFTGSVGVLGPVLGACLGECLGEASEK